MRWSLLPSLVVSAVACRAESPSPSTAPGPARLTRLTHVQWENTVVELLRLPAPTGLSEGFVRDVDRSPRASLTVSPVLWQQYQRAAESLAEQVVEDPALSPTVGEGPLGRDTWIRTFGRRAQRRPLTDAEVEDWTVLFEAGADTFASGDDDADGVRAIVAGMLQSPGFLYRTVLGATPDAHERASLVSYALWDSMPDDELLAAADGGLGPDLLAAQVARMSTDPRAHARVAGFHRGWLHVDDYVNIHKDRGAFPGFAGSVPTSMQAEVLAFTDAVVFQGGGVRDLYTSRRTFVNGDLAPIYGIRGIEGPELVAVELDRDQRAGLLTLSGFLAHEADETTENLVTRGAFVNATLLCADVPPPPDAVPPLPPLDPSTSLRDRVASHTGACGGECHTTFLNPIGNAFGHYDALGAWRADEHGLPIDASGTYPFDGGAVAFTDAVSLGAVLAERRQVHACYLRSWLESLGGGPLVPADEEYLDELVSRSLTARTPILDLLRTMVSRLAEPGR